MNQPLWQEAAEPILRKAIRDNNPVKKFVLFSGGNDSTVLAHWVKSQGVLDALVHIDTGTALPGVRDFVAEFANWLEVPLLVYEAGDAYERMVTKSPAPGEPPLGFPGPAQHNRAYTRLKERQIEQLLRDHRAKRGERFLLITGCRRHESRRRMGTSKPIFRKGGQVWVNPLIDWTNQDMAAYRAEHKVPQSDVAALMHRSGECNCGAYAKPGERQDIEAFYPEFAAWIKDLECRAEEAGATNCRWGEAPVTKEDLEQDSGPMCTTCQLNIEDVLAGMP